MIALAASQRVIEYMAILTVSPFFAARSPSRSCLMIATLWVFEFGSLNSAPSLGAVASSGASPTATGRPR